MMCLYTCVCTERWQSLTLVALVTLPPAGRQAGVPRWRGIFHTAWNCDVGFDFNLPWPFLIGSMAAARSRDGCWDRLGPLLLVLALGLTAVTYCSRWASLNGWQE